MYQPVHVSTECNDAKYLLISSAITKHFHNSKIIVSILPVKGSEPQTEEEVENSTTYVIARGNILLFRGLILIIFFILNAIFYHGFKFRMHIFGWCE